MRVKINMTHGNQMNMDNTAAVGVRPAPCLIAGQLPPDDKRAVADWISLNTGVIVAYWDGDIDTLELAQTLKPLRTE